MLARAVEHVAFGLFFAAIGVVLGAATVGPFEVVVVLPSLVGAAVLVLAWFPLLTLAARGRQRIRIVEVGWREAATELAGGEVGERDGQDVPERNGRA